MKSNTLALPIFISIIPLGLIILHLVDTFDVFTGKGDYPFNSEFFGSYSIYSSEAIYLAYNILSVLVLGVTILLSFKKKWKIFFVALLLDIILFCYPLITNT